MVVAGETDFEPRETKGEGSAAGSREAEDQPEC